MRTKTSELAVSGLTLSAALAICGTAAVAQEAEQVLDEIIVEAPWRVEREVVGRSASGAPIEEITLTRRIDISDLDLSQTADVGELETRIDDIASDSCDRLAEMFPLEDTDTRGCVDDATDDAMAQAQVAIAAATGQSGQEVDVATAPEDEAER